MLRASVTDLLAFIAVARERSFTRAAAQLGISQSALSHTIRGLETRLGVRLLTRSTRSVAPTAAGEQLLETIRPRFEEIEEGLNQIAEFREKPKGSFRITATTFAADTVLWPVLRDFLPKHPDVQVEVVLDYGLTDIITERCDAGIRHGGEVAPNMIAVPVSPELRMAVVATPAYFELHPVPLSPHDLTNHNCINLRLPTNGAFYAWGFEKDGKALRVRVEGQLAFNGSYQIFIAALDGCGLAYVPQALAQPHVEQGRLVSVLEDWLPPTPGYHLYYPTRRQSSAAFSLLVEALRYRS
ncbi:DNA-binding transcriptional LysR family regulator [Rhizobium sp. PP-F2F-G38]|uniref:LysR family transcriptional regulator n=1 Tax=Rhizobium sp. PP-CC-3G-465 TaxID=2135648 RepID=UPI000D982975|nr:DNA-binding transcriptional LysR family regulator [Rhizobium sp. PP-WC-1G-195]PYE92985.1 DNA-binding transcriptional LysR family regulator [Rhizobium sp. PP-F2F-G38]TCP79057.1 LysR family transcriptional regulator [Rhizobium sp. PP-CC-2G-626]TCQ15925.1 LysR family transcriptional regulator [Rhizobium sp. PP-CC-3G-465]